MFCETVVLLSKGMVESRKVKVDFFLEDMDLSEFKGKATYEQIKAYVLEQTGLKVSSLYIAQIKKKCGLDVGENYNLSKSENARQPKCTPKKEEAIMQAFKHFGIVQIVDKQYRLYFLLLSSEKRTFLNRNCYGSRDVLFGCLGVSKGQGNETEGIKTYQNYTYLI